MFKIGDYVRNRYVPHMISKIVSVTPDYINTSYNLENDMTISEENLIPWTPEEGEWCIVRGKHSDVNEFIVRKWDSSDNTWIPEPFFGDLPTFNNWNKNLLFVYGTLKSNHCNVNIMKSCNVRLIGNCTTVEKYPMYMKKQYFPYLQENPGIGENIVGELYEISPEYFENMDDFEGVPKLYYRKEILVNCNDKIFEAQAYFVTDKLSIEELNNKEFLKEF